MNYSKRYIGKKHILALVWLSAVLVMAGSGVGYRVWAHRLKTAAEGVISPAVPLKAFPFRLAEWSGRDVPISENVRQVAGNDDSLNRLYINDSTGQWANLYIAYSGRPRTMIGHRPEVCYVSGGWVYEDTRGAEVLSPVSRKIPCLIHRFRRPAPDYAEVVVLNFYILNGRIIRSEEGFTGLGWRTPNIAGDPARYVTKVQISSVLETSVLSAARDFTETILDFFPNSEGVVRAQDYIDILAEGRGE